MHFVLDFVQTVIKLCVLLCFILCSEFSEEVATLLLTGLTDTLVYNYIVVELDQIRSVEID